MLLDTLLEVRRRSEALIAPLEPEDLMLQGMADASPPKWHLGHTNWFFDTFVLQPHAAGHRGCDPLWNYQFNSYYDAVGARHPRPQRGLLSRPAIGAVLAWRQRVDAGLEALLQGPPEGVEALVQLGLQHRHLSCVGRLRAGLQIREPTTGPASGQTGEEPGAPMTAHEAHEMPGCTMGNITGIQAEQTRAKEDRGHTKAR